jgi:ribosomal-protein-alanine N-acetyltransferase
MNEAVLSVPELQTKRLVLRQLTENDLDFIFQIFSREETNLHVADPPVRDMGEARELYEMYIRPRTHLFRLGIFLKTTGEPIGTIGLYGIKTEDFRAVLGFDLLKEFWGLGYMTEAGTVLLEHAFDSMGLNRIQASADADNARSLATIERLGFTKEGIMRQKDFYKGAFHDDVVYSMLREDWQKRASPPVKGRLPNPK